jgi:hypothetical protein
MLKRALRTWLRSIIYGEDNPKCVATSSIAYSLSANPVLRFSIYHAVGGRVVEFRSYDQKADRENSTTYISTHDGVEFGNWIAKIITLESMK